MKSEIGQISIDRTGAALGVARIAAEKSYQGTGALLKKVIEDEDKGIWDEIRTRVNYTYEYMDRALAALEKETQFLAPIRQQAAKGKKLLFKPNLVSVESIEPYTHQPVSGTTANTEWIFVAAALRWFHDRAGFRYDQMCLGEAASSSLMKAARYSWLKKSGRPVTTEAVYEGRSDDFYGGWGFYFARRYLNDALDSSSEENPMNGLEESMAGIYIPPGEADGRLMLYDLNKISDDPSKGRTVELPDGENFKSIILHKVIVGGDPANPEDCERYPGSVLINLPKLKVHSNAMFTNAIKNLGIGLYSLQANHTGDKCGGRWAYGFPDTDSPAIKSRIPHQVWIPELEPDTLVPVKNPDDTYKVTRTAGLTGTMLDIIRATASQDVFMMHIVDAIETVNRCHQGIGLGVPVPEGLIIAGTDVVATDLMCARYIFSNVGLKKAVELDMDDGFGGLFPQAVPLPEFDGKNIRTSISHDCVIARDASIARAREWNLGTSCYYIKGWDAVSGSALASYDGRLGYLEDDTFFDIRTRELYWDLFKLPWDLQRTFLAYMDATDDLEKKSRRNLFIEAFDETGNGAVSYEENGKKGIFSPALFLGGIYMNSLGEKDDGDMFRAFFALTANPLKGTNPEWNESGHHFHREFLMGSVTVVAMMMSSMQTEEKDHCFPQLTWGKGKWPSYAQALDNYLHQVIYGWKFPKQIGLYSLYGSAIAYADHTQNSRQLLGQYCFAPNPKAPMAYLDAVRDKKMEPLDFTFFVPEGYGAGGRLPNIEETSDPVKIFTVEFEQGKMKWPYV